MVAAKPADPVAGEYHARRAVWSEASHEKEFVRFDLLFIDCQFSVTGLESVENVARLASE